MRPEEGAVRSLFPMMCTVCIYVLCSINSIWLFLLSSDLSISHLPISHLKYPFCCWKLSDYGLLCVQMMVRWQWFWSPHYSHNECICFSISLNALEMFICPMLLLVLAAYSIPNNRMANEANVTSIPFIERWGRSPVHFSRAQTRLAFFIAFATALFAIIKIKTIKIESIFYSVFLRAFFPFGKAFAFS